MNPTPFTLDREEARLQAALLQPEETLLNSLRREDRRRRWRQAFVLVGSGIVGAGIMGAGLLLWNANRRAVAASRTPLAPVAVADLAPTTAPVTPAPHAPLYASGQTVEIHWATTWLPGKILERDGDIYRISYDKWKSPFFQEWVTVDRLRKPGDTRDMPYSRPTPHGQKPSQEERDAALVNLGLAAPAAASTDTPPTVAHPDNPTLPADTVAQVPWTWAGARKINDQPTGHFIPDPETPTTVATSISLGTAKRDFFEEVERLLPTSPQTAIIGISSVDTRPGQPQKCRVDFAEIHTGRIHGSISLPPTERALALSPDATRLLATNASRQTLGQTPRLDLFDIHGTTPTHLVSFTPSVDDATPTTGDIPWAAFIDANHLVFVTSSGKLATVTLPDAKSVYTADIPFRSIPALSANHQYLAVPLKQGLAILRASTGETVLLLPTLTGGGTALFRADSAAVAIVSARRVRVVDLVKNEPIADIWLPPQITAQHASWVAPTDLLINAQYLVDLDKHAVVWRYDQAGRGNDPDPEIIAGRAWAIVGKRGPNNPKSLVSFTIPDTSAKRAIAALRLEDLLILHPGMKVSLDVSVCDPEGNQQVTRDLTDHFTKLGITVAPAQNITVSARVITGKSHDMIFQPFGSPPGTAATHVTLQDLQPTLTITVAGKDAWIWSSLISPPTIVQLRSGQTLDSKLAEARQSAWKSLLGIELPAELAAPLDPPGFGTSLLIPE